MRTIQKGREPASLTEYRKQPDADYDNYTDKAALRQALVAEQRALCCYCQSRIRATPEGMKIEHWQCQSGHPERQLDFSNLLGACRGNEGHSFDRQHCDTRKGNNALCFSVCDPDHAIERKIKFLGDGRIDSDDAAINWSRLVSNRKAVLDAFKKLLEKGCHLDPATELPKWDGTQAGDLPEFAQVVVYWLQKKQRRVTA